MTQNRDIARLLDAWLAEGPLEVSDRVFDDAIARLQREPARRGWHLPRRDRKVSMLLRLAAAAALVALLGVGAVLFGGARTTVPDATSTPATATPAATTAAAVTKAPESCLVDGTPKEPCRGRMEAGTYNLASPLVPLSVTVPAGWFNRMNVLGGVMLERDGDTSGGAIYVWSDPVIANQDRCVQAPDPGYGRTAADITAFLTANVGLDATPPQDVELGGLNGSRLELAVADGPLPPCGGHVQLFVHADTIVDGLWWDLSGDRRMAVWILDAGDGHTVLVNVEAREKDFDAFLQVATPIVESMVFTRQASCVDNSRCLGKLAPGTYTSVEMEVPLTFTVPDGWVNDWDVPLGYALVPVGTEDATEGGIFVFLDVYASTQVSCSRDPADGVGRGSADLVAWLGSLPDLAISSPKSVRLGGLSGTVVDVSVTSAGPVCRPDYQLWVSDYPPLWWGLTPEKDRMRHYLLDLPGRHNVLVVVSATDATFDDFTTSVLPIIESFDFAP